MLSHTLFVKRMAKRHDVLDSCATSTPTAFAHTDYTNQPLPMPSPQSASTDSCVAKTIRRQAFKKAPYTSACAPTAYASSFSPKHTMCHSHSSCLHPSNSNREHQTSNSASHQTPPRLFARTAVSRSSHHHYIVKPIIASLHSSNRKYTSSQLTCTYAALKQQKLQCCYCTSRLRSSKGGRTSPTHNSATAAPAPTATTIANAPAASTHVLKCTHSICDSAHSSSHDPRLARLIGNFHTCMCAVNTKEIEDANQHVSCYSFHSEPLGWATPTSIDCYNINTCFEPHTYRTTHACSNALHKAYIYATPTSHVNQGGYWSALKSCDLYSQHTTSSLPFVMCMLFLSRLDSGHCKIESGQLEASSILDATRNTASPAFLSQQLSSSQPPTSCSSDTRVCFPFQCFYTRRHVTVIDCVFVDHWWFRDEPWSPIQKLVHGCFNVHAAISWQVEEQPCVGRSEHGATATNIAGEVWWSTFIHCKALEENG